MQRLLSAVFSLCFLLSASAFGMSANTFSAASMDAVGIASLIGSPVVAGALLQDPPPCEDAVLRKAGARVKYDCCDPQSAMDAHYKAILLAIEQAQAVCEEIGCDGIGFVSVSTTKRMSGGACYAVSQVEYVCCCPCPTEFDPNCLDIDRTPCEGQEVMTADAEAEFECGNLESTIDAIKKIVSNQYELAKAKCDESGCNILDIRGICITFEQLDDETGLASGWLYFACCCEC